MKLPVKLNGKKIDPEIIYQGEIVNGALNEHEHFEFKLTLKENGVKVGIWDSYASIEVENGEAFISIHSKNINLSE